MKDFTKKSEVSRLIREALKGDLTTSNETSVKDFIDGIKKEYNVGPELLAFLVQKVNAFQLFFAFKEAKDQQVYPSIDLINVRDFCKKYYGYADILETIRSNLIAKVKTKGSTKTASLNIEEYSRLKKAASLNNAEEALMNDENVKGFNKYADSIMLNDLKELHDMYWSMKGIDKYIKISAMDSDCLMGDVLKYFKDNKKVTFTKAATLDNFLDFQTKMNTFKKKADTLGFELTPEPIVEEE